MLGPSASRRHFLELASGLALSARAGALPLPQDDKPQSTPRSSALGDEAILLEFDAQLHAQVSCRLGGRSVNLAPATASESLELTGGRRIEDFPLMDRKVDAVDDRHGKGRRLTLVGVSKEGVQKTLQATLYERFPGFVMLQVGYRNLSETPLEVRAWCNGAFRVQGQGSASPHFWSFNGGTYSDRRDWVRPVDEGFAQDNFMGMTASDYGSGTPIVDVWRRDCGIAVGHLAPTPQAVSLPIRSHAGEVRIAVQCRCEETLARGAEFQTLETFVTAHRGDHFATLDTYRRIMADRGMHAPAPSAAAYEAIWCAWGYERDCSVPLIEGTLPKVRDLGLRWAVIDDGWQNDVGDWRLNPQKFPDGEAGMRALVGRIRGADLKPRLWWAPLAVAPGSDVLHEQTDMLLLDKDGAVQNISWWNSFYLCPAYDRTLAYTLALVRRFVGEWGFAGLKIDGQHLNGVAPCYNPAHRHARPEESVEKLQDFFRAIYAEAHRADPDAVVELCVCGTSYAFYNVPAFDQSPASDPESSWQVRLKGKSMKALAGPSAAYAGDHVELSDGGDDFASTVGVGGIVSTKFTWPRDPKPKDSFLLTPEREALWRKWIGLYNEKMLPQGRYRGELYDIGFDKPEAHVVEKDGRLYYAFYASHWNGAITLRGLQEGRRYGLRDYFNDRELGSATAASNVIHAAFERHLLIEAIPT